MRISNRVSIGAGVLAGGLAGAAIGVAAGGVSDVIHACYAKRGGAMRIAGQCRAGEQAISWNKQGPAGSARAYAYVKGGLTNSADKPALVAARTKGFSSVSEPQNGVYCLSAPGLTPARTAPAVSAVYSSGFAGIPTTVKLYTSGTACRSTQFEVLTQDIQSNGSGGFTEQNSPNLDFTIVVP